MIRYQKAIKYSVCILPILLHLSKSALNRLSIDHQWIFWPLDVLVYLIVPVAALYILAIHLNVTPSEYGLLKRDTALYGKKDILVDACLSTLFLFIVFSGSFYLAYAIWPQEGVKNIYSDIIDEYNIFIFLGVKIYLSATAGFMEEVFYRGILHMIFLDIFKGKRLANAAFVIFSSLLFASAHIGYSPAYLVSVFCFGFAATLIYLHVRRLEPLIVAHIVIDLVYL